jgi:UDP-3-O-[3-hydroxymyristoyl] glucosamine N-acyltransferase
MPLTVADIARGLDAQIIGDPATPLKGFAPADRARAGDLTFAENETYFGRADESAASAIILDGPFSSTTGKVLIKVPNARIAFARVLPRFFPEPQFAAGIHPTAIVARSAQIDPTAHIGPYCIIAENVKISARCALHGANHIGSGCRLAEDVHLFPNVVLYSDCELGNRVRIHSGSVIGADGFGYVRDGTMHRKVPQIGNVIIRDDVEIGANVTVDRGALGPTIIGRGTKIDNLIQIGHNVVIGENCLVVAQTGIAGSTRLGNDVVLGGQVGLAGHLKIGNNVSVTAQSGVMHDIPDGQKWFGSPAQSDRQAKRQFLALQQLPDLLRRVAELERIVTEKEEG